MRYYIHGEPSALRVELAGDLNAGDASRLEQDWRGVSSAIGNRLLVVDVSFVTGIDQAAPRQFKRWYARGAEFAASSKQSREVVESITKHPYTRESPHEPTYQPWFTQRLEEKIKTPVGSTLQEAASLGPDGRLKVLRTAAVHFARTGLHGTTVSMLASAAGIPESILYAGFRNKERLFREAVENNINTRLRLLEARTLSATYESETMAVQRIAEATVRVCVVEAVTSILTSWALLEDHDYAANLYRNEIGSVEFVWNRALAERSPVGASQPGYDRPRHGRVPDEDGIEGMPGLSLLDVRKDD